MTARFAVHRWPLRNLWASHFRIGSDKSLRAREYVWTILFLLCAVHLAAGLNTLPIVTKFADLPQFTYSVPDSTEEAIRSPEAFARFSAPVEADLVRLQIGYDLQNDAIRRRVLELLVKLDLLAGRYENGIDHAKQLKLLQTKTSLRLTSMLVEIAYLEAAREKGTVDGKAFQLQFRKRLHDALTSMPYEVAYVNLVGIRGFAEQNREPFLLANASRGIEPARKKNEILTRDLAWHLVDARCEYVLMTVRDVTIRVIRAQEVAHGGKPKGIWPGRSVALDEHRRLTPVTVAVWDSGVDASLFSGRMWTSPAGLHGVAFTPTGKRTPELIWALTAEERRQFDTLSALVKGSSDVFADPDSPEAQLFRNAMNHTRPDEKEHLLGEMEHFRRASHGTGCAWLAAAGNPFIRILSARTSNDSEWTHQPPTVSWAEADVRIFRELAQYFRDQDVKVVNISWGSVLQDFERAVERYGNEQDPVRRKAQAQDAFQIEKQALFEAISNAPSILFVVGSGNSDEDAAGADMIPASFRLPNLITVGAVDGIGNAAPFTTFGSSVSIYASGFERAPLLGGRQFDFVGTSAAAPAVVNLAAKLLAVEPKLNPAQLISLIKRGASRNEEGLPVLNARRSFEVLGAETTDPIQ